VPWSGKFSTVPEQPGPAKSPGSPNIATRAATRDHQRRQLAAIMFADIVGYTALMQEDEQLGIESRTKYQNVLLAQHEVPCSTIWDRWSTRG
jgi:hypothetical protein